MCAALSVVILLFGQAAQVFDVTAAALCGLITAAVSFSFGGGFAAGQALVVTTLSFILLPDKTGAVLYFAIGGAYPVFKTAAERTRLCRAIKFAAALLLSALYSGSITVLTTESQPIFLTAAVTLLGLLCFWPYDILLSRLSARYGGRIRKFMRGGR